MIKFIKSLFFPEKQSAQPAVKESVFSETDKARERVKKAEKAYKEAETPEQRQVLREQYHKEFNLYQAEYKKAFDKIREEISHERQ